MKKLLKFLLLMMIALSSYSTSWCQNNQTSFTGDLNITDSLVLIPISYIKIANSKMIELEYEREINTNLNSIIYNDSIIIKNLNEKINNIENIYNTKINNIKTQRNIFIGSSSILSVLLILLLL